MTIPPDIPDPADREEEEYEKLLPEDGELEAPESGEGDFQEPAAIYEEEGEFLDEGEPLEEAAPLEEEERLPEPGEGEADFGGGVVPMPPETPNTKQCVFCFAEIPSGAGRCPQCSGFLPIAEGTIFKQYFFFLFACLALTIGCLLPWERTYFTGNLTGADSIGGGFMLLFAVYGMIVSIWNIYHRKMIVWPVLLAAVDGAILGWQRVFQIWEQANSEITALLADKYSNLEGFTKFRFEAKHHLAAMGPGLYLVVIFSTLVLLSVVVSIFKGAKQEGARKQAEREARMSSRKSRRA